MQQKYKDMLKGAAMAHVMSSSKSSDSTSNSKINIKGWRMWVIITWLMIVNIWAVLVGFVLLFELAEYGSINILGRSFEGARLFIIAIVLGGLGFYIYQKILMNFTMLFFWVTFLPFFICFLIWFFVPSVNIISYMPNMFWFMY